jgi:hypothetical protein
MQHAGTPSSPNEPVISLGMECARVEDLLREAPGEHVDLAIAAACVFHQVYYGPRISLPRRDYDVALNIAAAALSRLLTVYTLEPGTGLVALSPSLAGLFARGATEMRCQNGRRIGELSVQRREMLSAASVIRGTGLDLLLN